MSLTINDVLTRTVRTISPDIKVVEAACLMSEHRISCLVAVRSDKPVGILTEADLVQMAHLHINPEQTCISEFLSAPVISIEKDQSIYDAFDMLLEYQVRHLVIVHSDGRLKGILTFSDILKAAEFDDFLRVKPIRGIMSCQVVSARLETPLGEVLTQMDEQHLSCMVAVESGKACGIFTERDVARLLASDVDLDALTLGEAMTSPLMTMCADDSMLDAVLMMRKHGFRRVVIVDEQQQPVGIVTQFDVIRGMESKSIHYFQTLYDQMEGQLVVEKMELERIVGASPAVLYRSEWSDQDQGFVTTYISSSITPILGYERHECLQSGWWLAHIHPDDARLVAAGVQKLLEHGEIEHIYRFADKSGAYRWIRDHACLNKGVHGKPDEVIGSWLDITESRQRDQQVYENEELYRSLVEQAFDGIAIIGADGRVVFANQACAAIWHGSVEDVIAKEYGEFIHCDDRDAVQLRFQQRMDGIKLEHPYEARLMRENGDLVWVELSGRLITWHGQVADLVVMRNITGKKQAESELLLHRDRSEVLLNLPALASELGELELIQQAQALMEDLTGSCISFVHFVKDDAETIELTSWSRRTLESYCKADYQNHYPVSEAGIWADALRRKSAVVFNDYPACSNKKGLPEGHAELCRLISVPVMEHGQVVMLTGVGNKTSAYDDRDIESVQLISDAIWQIVQRQREQHSLMKSEEKYHTLFESSSDAIMMLDEAGFFDCNESTLRMFCCHSRDEFIGKQPSELSPETQPGGEDSLRLANEHIAEAFRNGSHSFEWTHKRLDGREFPTDILLTVLDLGEQVVLQATTRDITERKQKETLLARRERQLSVLAKAGKTINETLNEQQVGRKLVDFARKLVECESGAVGFYREGQMVFSEYLKGDQHQPICYTFPSGYGVPGHVLKTGKPYISHDALNDEYVIEEIQQKLGFIRLVDVPVLDADGAMLGCFEMHDRLDGQDFDDQDLEMLETLSGIASAALLNSKLLEMKVQSERQLTESAQQLLAAQHIARLGYYVLDVPSGTWSNSDELDEIFGIDEHFTRDIEGWSQIVHPDFRASMASYLQDNVLLQHASFDREYKIINIKTGKETWVHGLGELSFDNNRQVREMFGTIQDISERKQAEEQMRLLESAVGSVNESIIITDADGTIVYVNPSFTRSTGYAADYAVGKTPAILNSKQQAKGFYEQFWRTISQGKPWSGRILDRKKDGTIFPVHLSVAPIINAQGIITHYVAVHEDLTQAETMQKKMMQAQKMEAVGTMVGGLAHDFNNMLASIVGNFYLIRRQHPEDEKLLSRIHAMEASTLHGANMIRQMLTFSRKDHPEMHAMQLSSFIKEAHKLAEAAMPENICLALHISDSDGICVKADATQLQQVLLNLITNAQHAVEDAIGNERRGKITIEIDCQAPPDRLLQENLEMISDSGWCCIRCVDNGSGIQPDDLEHVFEPFFTTKGVGKGTGLGMAMVYGAVQKHRGLIDIDSTPGEGTTISIWLPQQREKVADVVGAEEAAFDGGGRTVLLVDDEAGLRAVLAEVLEHNGFTVLQACDGEQAVAMFRSHADQIAIVLMDVVMPNKGLGAHRN